MANTFATHPAARRASGARPRSPRGGFTLVELLVVVGIIAVLISIIMPTLGKVREQARQTKCLSNLRQLAMAFTMYTRANNDRYPLPAVTRVKEDWIHWEGGNRKLSDSAIAPYLAQPTSEDVFRCPSDDIWARPSGNYRYSYSANYLVCRLPASGWRDHYAKYYSDPRETNDPLKTTDIVSPADKILLIDESNDTADDGCWAWQQTYGSGKNIVSNRHDRSKEAIENPQAGRGNISFCDGHVDFIGRSASYTAYHYDPKKSR